MKKIIFEVPPIFIQEIVIKEKAKHKKMADELMDRQARDTIKNGENKI